MKKLIGLVCTIVFVTFVAGCTCGPAAPTNYKGEG